MTRYEHIVLYDGVCGLCDRFVQWVCQRDPERRFAFAPLQSDWAKDVLQRHGMPFQSAGEALTSVVVIARHNEKNEKVFTESNAILFTLIQLGGIYKLAWLGKLVPRFLRDAVYRYVARHRYGWFGQNETCSLPSPEFRDRFLEL